MINNNINNSVVKGEVLYRLVDINTGEVVYENTKTNNVTMNVLTKAFHPYYAHGVAWTTPYNGSIVWSSEILKPHAYGASAEYSDLVSQWKFTNSAIPGVQGVVANSPTYTVRASSTTTVTTSITWSNRLTPPGIGTSRTINSVGVSLSGDDIGGTGNTVDGESDRVMAFTSLDSACIQSDSLYLDLYYKIHLYSDGTVEGDEFIWTLYHYFKDSVVQSSNQLISRNWSAFKFSPIPLISDLNRPNYWLSKYGTFNATNHLSNASSTQVAFNSNLNATKNMGYAQLGSRSATSHVGNTGTATFNKVYKTLGSTFSIQWAPAAQAGCIYAHSVNLPNYSLAESVFNYTGFLTRGYNPTALTKVNGGLSHIIPKKNLAVHDYKLYNVDDTRANMGGPILSGSWDHLGTPTAAGRHRTASFPHMYRLKVLTTGNVDDGTPPKYTYEKHIFFNCSGFEKANIVGLGTTGGHQYACGARIILPHLTGGTPFTQLLYGPRDGFTLEQLYATIGYDNTTIVMCNKKGYIIVYNIAAGEYQAFYNSSITNPTNMAVKDNNIFIGCRNSGLWRVNPKTEDELVQVTGIAGLTLGKCFGVSKGYNNSLWIIGEDGLARYDGTWGSGGWNVINASSTPAFTATTQYSSLGRLTVDTSSTAHRLIVTRHWDTVDASFGWWWQAPGGVGTHTALPSESRNNNGTNYTGKTCGTYRLLPSTIQCIDGRWLFACGENISDSIVRFKEATFGVLTDLTASTVNVNNVSSQKIPVLEKGFISRTVGGLAADTDKIFCSFHDTGTSQTVNNVFNNTKLAVLSTATNTWVASGGGSNLIDAQMCIHDEYTPLSNYNGYSETSIVTTTSSWPNYGYGNGISLQTGIIVPLETGVGVEFKLRPYASASTQLGTSIQIYNGVTYGSITAELYMHPRWVNTTHGAGSALSYTKDTPGYKKFGWNGTAWEEDNVNGRPLHTSTELLENGINVRWSDNTNNPTNSFEAGDCYNFVASDGIWKTNATTFNFKQKEWAMPNETINLTNFATAGTRTAVGVTGYTTIDTRLSCTNMFTKDTSTHEFSTTAKNTGIIVMAEKLYGDWTVRFHVTGRSGTEFYNGVYGIGAVGCSVFHQYFVLKTAFNSGTKWMYPANSSGTTPGTNFHSILSTGTVASGNATTESLYRAIGVWNNGSTGLAFSNTLANSASVTYIQVTKSGNTITVGTNLATNVTTRAVSENDKEMSIWYYSGTRNEDILKTVVGPYTQNGYTTTLTTKFYPCEIVSNGTAFGEIVGSNGTPKTGKYADMCIGFDTLDTEFSPTISLNGTAATSISYTSATPVAGAVGFNPYTGVIYTNAADAGKTLSISNAVAMYLPTPLPQT